MHLHLTVHLIVYTAAVCLLVDDLYLHSMLGCVHVHKAHGDAIDRRGQENTVFGTLLGLTKQFEA